MRDRDIAYRCRRIAAAANEARHAVGENSGDRGNVAVPQSRKGIWLRAARAGVDHFDAVWNLANFGAGTEQDDADLDGVRTRLRQSREQELQLLTSPEAKELLERHGIQLISYREL